MTGSFRHLSGTSRSESDPGEVLIILVSGGHELPTVRQPAGIARERIGSMAPSTAWIG